MSTETNTQELTAEIRALSTRARQAQKELGTASRERKDSTLLAMAEAVGENRKYILAENAKDMQRGKENGTSEAMLDRLLLTDERIDGLVSALKDLAALPDPTGVVVRGNNLPNGIRMQQVRVPMGVVGAIYEARPNVTVDIAGIGIKSGNAVILRGGSAAENTNAATISILRAVMTDQGFDADLIQSIDEFGRDGAQALMRTRGSVDVLIPRGGASLIQSVVQNSKVPVIETGAGVVHVYIDASADIDKAVNIALNSKTHRVSVCNAAETLIIHEDARDAGVEIFRALDKSNVALHLDETARRWVAESNLELGEVSEATQEDWATEYLDYEMAVRVVKNIDDAIEHVSNYSTMHTEVIVTESLEAADTYIAAVDAAVVMVNASSRFTDGGQFGLGAEIGISTQKMHARGPMGLEELTTTKWILRGDGQIRQ